MPMLSLSLARIGLRGQGIPHFIDPTSVFWPYWALFAVQVVTLVALVLYVWKTWEMAKATRDAATASGEAARANTASVAESREARIAAMAPRMMIYFATRSASMAEIVLENVGAGTAADVLVTFEPRLRSSHPTWDPSAFFDSPKTLFPPAYRVMQMVDSWPAYLRGDLPKRYAVRVQYRGIESGRTYDETHTLDASAFEHRTELNRKGVHEVAGELGNLAKAVERGAADVVKQLEVGNGAGSWSIAAVAPFRDELAALLALWRVAELIDESPELHIGWGALQVGLQCAALRAVVAAARDRRGDEVNASAVQVLVNAHAPIWVDGDKWSQDMRRALEKLAATDESLDDDSTSDLHG